MVVGISKEFMQWNEVSQKDTCRPEKKLGQAKTSNFDDVINKAGYTAQDAPSTRLKITRDGPTDGRTYGRTYGRTDGHTLIQRCDGASKKINVKSANQKRIG